MTREKKNSDWDDLQIMLNSPSEIEQELSDSASETSNDAESVETQASEDVDVTAAENDESVADATTPENDATQETAGDEGAAEKKEKKSAAKNAEKDPEAKKPRATRAAKKDSADEVKPAPKRARGRRSAASEKELEVSKTFGDVISQIASVAQGKRAAKKSAPVETELNVESSVESAPDVEVESFSQEPKVEAFQEPTAAPEFDPSSAASEERGSNETLFATFIGPQPEDVSDDEKESRPFVDDALPDGFWSSSEVDSEQESLENILWSSQSPEGSTIPESLGTTEPIEEAIGGVEFFVESEKASETSITLTPSEADDVASESSDTEEEEVASAESPDQEQKDDDFWGFSDSLDISWGTSPAVEKTVEPVAEDAVCEDEAPTCDAVEPEGEAADETEVVAPATEEKKLTSVDEIDFNDPNDLSSFFDFAPSDDLGFAPRKKEAPKQKREKPNKDKDQKRASEAERPEKKQVAERDSATNVSDVKEPRAPRSDRRRDYEEVEEPREPRSSRNDRRRDYDEVEEPREPRASRNDRRRDYDDEEEQPRTSRSPRNDRRRDYDDEEEPRESRAVREDRRRATSASSDSPKDADGARKPERILPSWDEAIGYVVNFNLSRRLHRGRGGK